MRHQSRPKLLFTVVTVLLLLTGCNDSSESPPLTSGSFQPINGRDLRIVTGQSIYVPAYSEVFYGQEGLNMELAVTLAIHNTDLDASIIIRAVRYYDTNGHLVRDYIDQPVEVAPLATTGFLVDDRDMSGGWGANFIVEWVAEEPVYEPIVEAIMIGARDTQGISMISPGRVISEMDGTPTQEPK